MRSLQKNKRDFENITALIQQYFDGLHNGDVSKLKSIFHHDVWLKAPGIRRSLKQWLTDVKERESPIHQERAFEFKLLSIDVVNNQAMVKVQCPLFNFNYIDFIGLLKEEGHWLIVSKMYTDISMGDS
ncbi:nuclear transport factor 2 family protein [Pseudoalteromonas denitrificans]|uniref:Putative lumazine-binding n=1 Tax=Pseudoalteromonas denitrificans DSM 6059 TaxID=1123010 RepID=A0A1I1V0S4_9GAMM|nr:nuclear transport factor 2 family protein [Pseudoalteromonas denitrificans]SFD76524.1 Putative lumazine-binding [Pseudoalteromonas denitrificans DSM 6059]